MTSPLVLHVRGVTGSGGGPEKTILSSPAFLEKLGYDSLCAYMRPPNDSGFDVLRTRAEHLGAPLVEIDDRGALDWRVIRDLLRVCREKKVAIWHAHDYKSNLFGLIIQRFWPMKLVTTVHGWVQHTSRTPLYYFIDKQCLYYYHTVVCVSEDLRDEVLTKKVANENCHLIHNGIDTKRYYRQKSVEEAKKELGADPNRFLIGAVGRLSPEKGFDLLIQAANRLIKKGHDISVWIAGEGDAKEALQQQIKDAGLEDRIRLLGHINDPATFYQAMDLYVLSSLREGLPNVVLEAMAFEAPIVATKVAGVPFLIEHEKTGLLVDLDSVDELESGIERMYSSPELQKSCTANARTYLEENYSFERRMQKVAALYDQLLERSPVADSSLSGATSERVLS
ncbi:MAG: glycosyl transferase family 1 [Blastopirellula sp.]|nr:MAG: glycosyl transferase family 1 [Blastopirellula sp.]